MYDYIQQTLIIKTLNTWKTKENIPNLKEGIQEKPTAHIIKWLKIEWLPPKTGNKVRMAARATSIQHCTAATAI